MTVSPETLELEVGQSQKLTVTVEPSNSTDAPTFESTNSEAVQVSSNGTVSAIAEGFANIVVKAGEQSAACAVTVKAAPVVHSEFQMSLDAPATATVGEEVTANVGISVKTEGNTGYDKVQFQFDSQRPEGVNITFKATDSAQREHKFVNSGTWGPPEGFPISADYSATTQWKISADKAGSYQVTYKLVNLEDSSVICESTESIEITE